MINAIIYDIGGTLLYPKPPIEELCARAAGMPAALIDRDGLSPPLDCPALHRLDDLFLLLDAQA